MLQRPTHCAAALLFALSLSAAQAGAQASSACYYDQGRMVDAAPLAGTKVSTAEQTGNLNYLLYLPQGHDPAKKWPVVVFMHGIGEVINGAVDLNALTKHSLPRQVENPDWNWPFIVISPEIPSDGWVNHADEVAAALDSVEAMYGGDHNRTYLTGLSYGGVGTYSVGIALADRIAALMPVNPGGTVSNWDQRAVLKDKPIWLFTGSLDNEYGVNTTRTMDIEADGGEAFFKYTYAFADEYNDVAPPEALQHKHVFGTYTDIGHDVWHATYGVYCPEDPALIAKKTVQYNWLLSQSLDGSPFVDPRDPTFVVPPAGGAGGMAATAGAAGADMGGAGGVGGASGSPVATAGAGAGGDAGAGGGVIASGGVNSMAGASAVDMAAAGSAVTPPTTSSASQSSGGCSLQGQGGGRSLGLLLALTALLGLKRRNRR